MNRWIPLAVALALVAIPAAAAQQQGAETHTNLETDGGLALAPGQAGNIDVQVTYRYQPVPWTSPTPTHLAVESAPSNVTVAFGTSTVYHEVEDNLQEDPVSVELTTLTVVAADDAAEETAKVTLSGLSEANGPHASSQGDAEFIVKVDEASDGASSTQSAGLSPASAVPAQALASLAAVGGLALGLHRLRD